MSVQCIRNPLARESGFVCSLRFDLAHVKDVASTSAFEPVTRVLELVCVCVEGDTPLAPNPGAWHVAQCTS